MKQLLPLILIALVIPACENVTDFSDEWYQQYKGSTSIDSDINFNPVEVYNSGEVVPPILKLQFFTTKSYGCINYRINTTQFENKDELILRFDKVEIGPVCLTAIGPAYTSILLPEKTKYVVLINGDKIDEYEVTIDEEKVYFSPKTVSFSNLKHRQTFRYPKDSFALLCGTNVDNTHLCGDFYTLLTDSTNVSEFTFEGDGIIPYPDSTSGNWRNNPATFFTYSSFEEYLRAGDLLKSFSEKNLTENDGVTIYMSSWNNKHFRSWMF